MLSISAAREISTRDRLVLEHMGLVSSIAVKLKQRLPPCFELDDLKQAGMLGLLEAAATFDPARHPGVEFAAFARRRIKGAMQDSVGMHSARSKRSRARNWLESTRPPIAEHNSRPGDGAARETPDGAARADALLEQRERREVLRELLSHLTPNESVVIELHYGRDLEMAEIARIGKLKVTRGRLGQLRRAAVARMRRYAEISGMKAAA